MTLCSIGKLYTYAKICNIKVNHIKPHGALYHLVCNNDEYANIFIEL